jgi:hypothetical protein
VIVNLRDFSRDGFELVVPLANEIAETAV